MIEREKKKLSNRKKVSDQKNRRISIFIKMTCLKLYTPNSTGQNTHFMGVHAQRWKAYDNNSNQICDRWGIKKMNEKNEHSIHSSF